MRALLQQFTIGFDNQLHGFAQVLNIAESPFANLFKNRSKFHGDFVYANYNTNTHLDL